MTSEVKVSSATSTTGSDPPPAPGNNQKQNQNQNQRGHRTEPEATGEHGSSEQQDNDPMEPSPPGSLYVRSTSMVSLNERFTEVLKSQLIRVTSEPRRRPQRVVLPPKAQRMKQRQKMNRGRWRGSVWTRLGGLHLSYWRLPGFWSFRKKYTWRARSRAPYRSRQRLKGTLQRGGAMAEKGWSYPRKYVPTKKQLDAQLDEYMSLSKRRLDQQLEDYMSMSRRCLDEQLDEYMLMAGQSLQD